MSTSRTKAKGKVKQEHQYQPFWSAEEQVWKIWDPKQGRLRILKGVRLVKKGQKKGTLQGVDGGEKGRIETMRKVDTPIEKSKQREAARGKKSRKRGRKSRKDRKPKAIKVPPKVVPDVRIPITMPGGEVVELRGDGHIWHKPKAYGGEVCTQIKREAFLRLLTGDKKGASSVESECLKWPELEWKISEEVLKEWCERLLWFNTEALLVYGKLEDVKEASDDKPLWMAVVPEQEVMGAGVDVDDFGPAIQKLARLGYRRVGSIHTHPGSGSRASGMDKSDLFDGFGGLHLIVSRTGVVNYYYAMGAVSWRLTAEEKSPWHVGKLWKGNINGSDEPCSTIITEKGGTNIAPMLKPKVYAPAANRAVGFYGRGGYKSPDTPHEKGKPVVGGQFQLASRRKRKVKVGDVEYEWNPATQRLEEIEGTGAIELWEPLTEPVTVVDGGEVVPDGNVLPLWRLLREATSIVDLVRLMKMVEPNLTPMEAGYVQGVVRRFMAVRRAVLLFSTRVSDQPMESHSGGTMLLTDIATRIRQELWTLEFNLWGWAERPQGGGL